MELRYRGHEGTVVPLPEGWPAMDHTEDDEQIASEKLSSGYYDRVSATERTTITRHTIVDREDGQGS